MVILNDSGKNVSLYIYNYSKSSQILNSNLDMKGKSVNSVHVKGRTLHFIFIIKVQFETRSTFKGLIFVEDHLADPSCRSIAAENVDDTGRNASIRLGFKSCDVERRRSVGSEIY